MNTSHPISVVTVELNQNGDIFLNGKLVSEIFLLGQELYAEAQKIPMPSVHITGARRGGESARSLGKVIYCSLGAGFTEEQLILLDR